MADLANEDEAYALPDTLPDHLRQQLEELPLPTQASDIFVDCKGALKSQRTQQSFRYELLRTREILSVEFY